MEFGPDGIPEISTTKSHPHQARAAEIRTFEIRPFEVNVYQKCPIEVSPAEIGAAEVAVSDESPRQTRSLKVGIAHVKPTASSGIG